MTLCPKCGHDLEANKLLIRGDWQALESGEMVYRDRLVGLTPGMHRVLSSIFRAYPQALDHLAIAERSDVLVTSARVMLSQLRARLRECGVPVAFSRCPTGLIWRA